MTPWLLFKRQMIRESRLLWRQRRLTVNSCLFFLMIVVFFPLTLPPDAAQLRLIAPGIVWIALLFALFLSAERLFQQDYEDGVIEQWLVSGHPVPIFVSAKMLVHWWINIIPMLFFCPLLAVMLNLTLHETFILMLSLLCGSPTILALCSLAAALSTSLKHQGVLMALILLPLTIPVMVFGSAAPTAAMQQLPTQGYLVLLFALSLLTTALLPWAIGAVIRESLVD